MNLLNTHATEPVSPISNPIGDLFVELDCAGIDYVIWKNRNEITQAKEGLANLDIYVPWCHRSKLNSICVEKGWLQLYGPTRTVPYTAHYYKPDNNLVFIHIHVYYKCITGESAIKEYVLPLDEFLIRNRVRDPISGMWVLSDRAQAYVIAVRHLLKGGSALSRRQYRKHMTTHKEQWIECNQDPYSIVSYGPIDLAPYMKGSGLMKGKLLMPTLASSIKFRLSLAPFLRVRIFSMWHMRVRTIIGGSIRKTGIRRKRRLYPNGIIIAISGVEGTGKSTMVNELCIILSSVIETEQYHIGKPPRPSNLITNTVAGIVTIRKRGSNGSGKADNLGLDYDKRSRIGRLRKSIGALEIAICRIRLARLIARRARGGRVAIVDRWPTDEWGKMDGPRLGNSGCGEVRRVAIIMERWAYSRMPRADLCIVLKVPLDVSRERNRTRIKKGKESDSDIVRRYNNNIHFYPLSDTVIEFDNRGSVDINKRELIQLVWMEMAKRT